MNNAINLNLVKMIPRQRQVRCDTDSQLLALITLALKFGLYDAADIVRNVLRKV